MKRLYFISSFFLAYIYVFGQVKQIDLYKDFQKNKPKYKKAVRVEVLWVDDEPFDTLEVVNSEWTDNELKTTTYHFSSLYRDCKEETAISTYDSANRNTMTTKCFCFGKLKTQYHKVKYTDSILSYGSDTLIWKSTYNKKDNSWTWFYKNGNKTQIVYVEDSIKTVEIEYENDSFSFKTITYKQRNFSDSIFVFDKNNKLISKVIERFNNYGDLIYQEKLNINQSHSEGMISIFTYVYDENNYWTEKLIKEKYFPNTDEKRVAKKIIRRFTF